MLQDELLATYGELKESLDTAPESPVPFPVLKDEKMAVVGDANETQLNKHDFKIRFRLPEGVSDGEKVVGGVVKEVEYKNVFITPRQSGKVVSAICRMLPFFRDITAEVGDEGEVKGYSYEEVMTMLATYGDEFIDDMYGIVSSVLKVDPALVDYMEMSSVIEACTKIFKDYPEVLNEAESFFS